MSVYRLYLEPDDNGTVLATVPALPEVTTFGEDELQAIAMAGRAVEEALAARMASGEDIPPTTMHAPVGGHFVFTAAMVDLKVALYRLLRATGINRAELARRMGVHRNQVDRLFDLDHQSKLDQFEDAFFALGHHLNIDVSLIAA